MKNYRVVSVLLGSLLPLFTLAIRKDSVNAVTMVSYEQQVHDIHGTLALRNNTNEQIKNITFIITYLDMSDIELDYDEFHKDVDIAPGMTKKIDIPAYEWERNYRYYKTKDRYGLYPSTFKIKFGLKGYNTHNYKTVECQEFCESEESNQHGQQENKASDYLHTIGVCLVAVLTIAFVIGMYALVGVMARRRNRDAALWVVLSFVMSPFLIIIILLCTGKKE